ncbi:MAG: hypothetical protein M9887_08710 [Chitinophagales bacterium]|nr:hypothetical protein [Chitinophagales bacterium]
MTEKISLRFTVLTGLILACAFSRMIPHFPNFSPLGAIGLFGVASFAKKWQAFLIPIVATWLSDLFINNIIYAQYFEGFAWFYSGFYWQYLSYLLIIIAGVFIFKKVNTQRVLSASLVASLIFFIVSNFGVWAGGLLYPKTMEGLVACYVAALPYLQGTFMGDLFYTTVLIGGFALLQNRYPILR